ncbi:MAG: amidohydrolase family protein, partial [Myxococcota bacterium]
MWIRSDAAVLPSGRVARNVALEISPAGTLSAIEENSTRAVVEDLGHSLLVPGTINAHSHAFQRALRGATQRAGPDGDTFWTWREGMYSLAESLSPASIYVIARQMFLEMALAGTTTVGEFHYVHHRPDGSPYANSNELAIQVIEAARAVGIRIALLRVIYLRGGFHQPDPEPRQRRFVDASLDHALDAISELSNHVASLGDPRVWLGAAAHSVRAVPVEAIVGAKTRLGHVPFHLHVSEQEKEVTECIETYGVPPVQLLAQHGV